MTWIKGSAATKDGRGAFKTFKAHFMGTSELENLANKAEGKLDSSVYVGEHPRYNFEMHVTTHQRAHLDLSRAGGRELTGRDKVRRLLKSISAPNMTVPVATVRATENLRVNWDECLNYLRQFVEEKTMNRRQISATGLSVGRGKFKKKRKPTGEPVPKVEDRYYTPSEWRILVKKGLSQKVLELRNGRTDNSRAKRVKNEATRKVKASNSDDEGG